MSLQKEKKIMSNFDIDDTLYTAGQKIEDILTNFAERILELEEKIQELEELYQESIGERLDKLESIESKLNSLFEMVISGETTNND
ncbi:hypothetical protein [Flavobacterium sp.]|uniref:hypothetical protein n=1 Tax=Flavobacterium sp. TaxID=239 RepID=UPI003F6A1C55